MYNTWNTIEKKKKKKRIYAENQLIIIYLMSNPCKKIICVHSTLQWLFDRTIFAHEKGCARRSIYNVISTRRIIIAIVSTISTEKKIVSSSSMK